MVSARGFDTKRGDGEKLDIGSRHVGSELKASFGRSQATDGALRVKHTGDG